MVCIWLMRMNPKPVTMTPKIMTRLGPNRSSITPTKGEMSPLSPRWMDTAAAKTPWLHPVVFRMGSTKAWKPRQKTADA